MTAKQIQIYTKASQLATDADLMRIFALTPEQLEKHREMIERARAEAMVQLRFERAQATARKAKSA